jgi:hypothetical protein
MFSDIIKYSRSSHEYGSNTWSWFLRGNLFTNSSCHVADIDSKYPGFLLKVLFSRIIIYYLVLVKQFTTNSIQFEEKFVRAFIQ